MVIPMRASSGIGDARVSVPVAPGSPARRAPPAGRRPRAGGQPEHRADRVADELLDRAAVPLDGLAHRGEVAVEQRPQHLRVVPFAKRLSIPTRSQNSAVTILRVSGAVAVAPSGVAQPMQNEASAGFARPHDGQVSIRRPLSHAPGIQGPQRSGSREPR